MKHSATLVFLVIILVSSFVFAEPPSEEPKKENTLSQQQMKIDTMSIEILTLRVTLDEMRRSEDRLLATVLWSISGVFTLAIALAVYSWYTSSRVHQREVKLLKQDMNNEIDLKVQSVNKEIEKIIEKRLSEKESELANSNREHINKLQADVIAVTKLSEAKLRLRIGDIDEAICNGLESFGAAIHGNTNYIAHAIDVITEALDSTAASENKVKSTTIDGIKNLLRKYRNLHNDQRAIALNELVSNWVK